VSNAVFSSGSASNYTITYLNGTMTVTPREANVAYIGQTTFVTSGTSDTTAQVTLTASIQDPDGRGSVANATVTFKDLLSGKILAQNVPVSLVSNTDTTVGTANTVVTLSTGQYGSQMYLIEVTLGGSYKNVQQTGALPSSTEYQAAHPTVTVMTPAVTNSVRAAGSIGFVSTSAGMLRSDIGAASNYTIGLKYNKGGTNPQGQILITIPRSDGIYYVKSNSISSLAFSGMLDGTPTNTTIYTKASIYKILPNGTTMSVDGNVTLRVDAYDGKSGGDKIGFTVLSSKDSSLYYSNNWQYDSTAKAWRTIMQDVDKKSGDLLNLTGVVIA
jgi:hypothetical protein